jgi:hypothetical protein
MNKIKFILLGITLYFSAMPCFAQKFESFYKNNHFEFFREDTLNYHAYIEQFNRSYTELYEKLDLETDQKIKIFVFKSQKSFIEYIFGYYEKKVTSVGMTKPKQNVIYISSFRDSTAGRTYEEFMNVVTHELTHALYFNENKWLSEGIALFLANQKREILSPPKNSKELMMYIDCSIINAEAYGYYSFFTRFLIKRIGFESFKKFYQSNMDWSIIGYTNASEFCEEVFAELMSLPNNVYKK